MRLVADSGLWSVGPATRRRRRWPRCWKSVARCCPGRSTIHPAMRRAQITFTDLSRADWLWRVFGEAGHVALAAAVGRGRRRRRTSIELAGVDIVPGSVDPLRRLAVGHWLRRWWPASRRDGIAGLDRALLDVEVALLTVGAQGFFSDDTLDSEVTGLLAPHAAALVTHIRSDDARIANLVRAGCRAGRRDRRGRHRVAGTACGS